MKIPRRDEQAVRVLSPKQSDAVAFVPAHGLSWTMYHMHSCVVLDPVFVVDNEGNPSGSGAVFLDLLARETGLRLLVLIKTRLRCGRSAGMIDPGSGA